MEHAHRAPVLVRGEEGVIVRLRDVEDCDDDELSKDALDKKVKEEGHRVHKNTVGHDPQSTDECASDTNGVNEKLTFGSIRLARTWICEHERHSSDGDEKTNHFEGVRTLASAISNKHDEDAKKCVADVGV